MVNKGRGRFINRPTKTGGKKYDKFFIYVPTEVARDSAFPLGEGEEVEIKIDEKNERILVESS
ncbi:hypothetical protein AKJ64_00460 [candidate division MSBL1 archaeon SCGC-AAA259E17]|uniref:SpoVT-AbrB domain-containing protein n=1 Tax=candidate division MSBL1 archaeon SCGC-AAA259E17 TaxID=1698263 RepID=A0A133UHD4_9EURY|nr:hypothetical protein AKJ64_00460 [candidate division MSBL1 archaeon SCGC-AAA259E17]